MSTDTSSRYALSFTSGGLFVLEAPVAARLFGTSHDWSAVRSTLDANNLLQARTPTSASRLGRELIQRLKELTEAELAILIEATADERAQLMWVALCRRYSLIAEFAEEVLHERFLLMAPDLGIDHFEAFIRGKSLWHPELLEVTQSTSRELRKSLFRMLREGNFVTTEGLIIPTVLSWRVRDALAKRDPSDVRLFATRETA